MARSVKSRLQALASLGVLPAQALDAVFPHGPILSKATKELALAQIVRDIALQVPFKEHKARLLAIGRKQVDFASSGLLAGWEEGDDLCPPWKPFPFPWPPSGPLPDPWFEFENLLDHARSLRLIAQLTTIGDAGKELEDIAAELGRQALEG